MQDDARIKRVLKRYPKGENLSDASMDVTALGVAELLKAFRTNDAGYLTTPKELDDYALVYMSRLMGITFERDTFDYFLHSYARQESVAELYADPSAASKPAPEGGPHSNIPLPKGTRWISVRPKDGQESYEAYEFDDTQKA